MRKLFAIADLHLGHKLNRDALEGLNQHPNDGLILCGDIGETAEHLELAFAAATRNFGQVWWCPGNHELYTMTHKTKLRGEDKYGECLDIARRHGVITPEDEYVVWNGAGGLAVVAPIFTLYDYSFRPAHVRREDALAWAEAADTVATDEYLLHPDPYPTRDAWCAARVAATERRLEAACRRGLPLVLANHWPLREDLVHIPRIPRFSLWCGTTRTRDWHTRFNACAVVSGHLHVPRTDWRDGVRFEEVSLGYPRQWEDVRSSGMDINDLLREILPGPKDPSETAGSGATQWRRWG